MAALTHAAADRDADWPSAPDLHTVRRLLRHQARLDDLIRP